jgi:anti-anti-sigma factor
VLACWVEELSHTGITVLHVRGEVDQETSHAFTERLLQASRSGHDVVVDLREVEFMPASCLRQLEIAQAICEERGNRLTVAAPPPYLSWILSVAGLDRTLTILPTLDQAVHGVRAQEADAAQDDPIMPWKLVMRMDTTLPTLRMVRKLVASAARTAGASDLHARLIEVAAGEALANARLHAYRDSVGPLEVTTEFDGLRIALTVRDRGEASAGAAHGSSNGSRSDSRGLGISLIGQVMDEVEIVALPGEPGTTVRMVTAKLTDTPDVPRGARPYV